jgi:hypothetical protein
VNGARTRVAGNQVYGNYSYGIYASGYVELADRLEVTQNTVYSNGSAGISATSKVLVSTNTVYGHSGTNDLGIGTYSGAVAANNKVFGNYAGIEASGLATGNRSYSNTTAGIVAQGSSLIVGNWTYSNKIGILLSAGFDGQAKKNVVYANSDQGLVIQAYYNTPKEVANNTIFQPVGDAVKLEQGAKNVSLSNNILWVQAGYGINVARDSQAGFASDYNMFYKTADPNAHIGFWDGSSQDTLAAWQTGTTKDAQSLLGDPLFVDPDGADNVLGYRAAEGGYDGGPDDNFQLSRGSPGIDRAQAWKAPATDALGLSRLDDPGTPNLGSPDYAARDLGASMFAQTGTAKYWRGDGSYWNLTLPFAFPFYGQNYTQFYVSSRGFLDTGYAHADDGTNTTAELAENVRIAPLWDELRTNSTGDEIYVDTSVADQATIRWNATLKTNGADANFAVTLFKDGRLRFDYGPGNTGLSPTAGISFGNQGNYLLANYTGRAELANVNSLEIALTSGVSYTDLGAYEFRGSSLDNTPPAVTNTSPAAIHDSSSTNALVHQIELSFNEEINPIDANARANYELRNDGGNGVFDDANDTLFVMVPDYLPGTTRVTLNLASGPLLPGNYRLMVSGDLSIHDLAGLRLDGDQNGLEGGNYVRAFSVAVHYPKVLGVTLADGALQRSRLAKIAVAFNEDVSDSLGTDDIVLRNLTSNTTLSPASMTLTYDKATNRAALTFPGLAGRKLPDGNYRLSILAAGIRNVLGAALEQDHVTEFHVLTGDVNGDRVTNDLDLYRVWQNQLKPAAARDLNDDLNGDGKVDQADVPVVKGNYLARLPAPVALAAWYLRPNSTRVWPSAHAAPVAVHSINLIQNPAWKSSDITVRRMSIVERFQAAELRFSSRVETSSDGSLLVAMRNL